MASKLCKECMTKEVDMLSPDDTLEDAAKMMREDDVGSVLVQENDRLVGVLTDRDIVIRACSEGLDLSTPVREVMTPKVLYCYAEDSIEDVAANMAENQVHRLPVLNNDKRLVGIISLGDLSVRGDRAKAAVALEGISQQVH